MPERTIDPFHSSQYFVQLKLSEREEGPLAVIECIQLW